MRPVWLVEQKIIPEDEAVQFNVVFEHSRYGWVNRRYRFDGFNNVLYYKGQIVLSEDEAPQGAGERALRQRDGCRHPQRLRRLSRHR